MHTSKSMMPTPSCSPPTRRYAQTLVTNTHTHINRRVVTDFVGGLSCVENLVMTDGLAPKRQRFGNHDDLVSVLLPFEKKRSWIEYMDESDNVINSKLDVNSILRQRDLLEALHKLSPTLALSKSIVLEALAAIMEIKGWKLEDDSATNAMHKILGARLRNMCRHVLQAVFFFVFLDRWF